MMMSEVRFVLDQHAELEFYSAISLKQQCTSDNKHWLHWYVQTQLPYDHDHDNISSTTRLEIDMNYTQ
jgi:hypothetical protein